MRYVPLLLATSLALPLSAQEPAPLRDTTRAVSGELLPVRDDDGNLIPDELIAARMRPARHQLRNPLIGALAGLVVFTALTQPTSDCSIYEPCTAREKFRMNLGPVVGLVVGGLVGTALPDGRVDRWQAVQLIREERRAAKDSTGARP